MINPEKYLARAWMNIPKEYFDHARERRGATDKDIDRILRDNIASRMGEYVKAKMEMLTIHDPAGLGINEVHGRLYILSEDDMKEFINSMLLDE